MVSSDKYSLGEVGVRFCLHNIFCLMHSRGIGYNCLCEKKKFKSIMMGWSIGKEDDPESQLTGIRSISQKES